MRLVTYYHSAAAPGKPAGFYAGRAIWYNHFTAESVT